MSWMIQMGAALAVIGVFVVAVRMLRRPARPRVERSQLATRMEPGLRSSPEAAADDAGGRRTPTL